eukprot:5628128-Pleurochrysis_carterae.AAC.1
MAEAKARRCPRGFAPAPLMRLRLRSKYRIWQRISLLREARCVDREDGGHGSVDPMLRVNIQAALIVQSGGDSCSRCRSGI